MVPEQAAKLGLVDGVVPKEQLLAAAREWAAAIAAGSKPRNFSLYRYTGSSQQLLHFTYMCACRRYMFLQVCMPYWVKVPCVPALICKHNLYISLSWAEQGNDAQVCCMH